MQNSVDSLKKELLELIETARGVEQLNFLFNRPKSKFKKYENDPEIILKIEDRLAELRISMSNKDKLAKEIEQTPNNPFEIVKKARGKGDKELDIDAQEGFWTEKTTADIYRNFLRFWAPALNEYEIKFMLYLFEKLEGYGKTGDYIAVETMINGTVKVVYDKETKQKTLKRIDFGTGIGLGKTYKAREALHYRIADRCETMGMILIRRGTKANPSDKYPTNHYRLNLKKNEITWDDVKPLTRKK